jgi:hypothetical protein
MAQPAVTEHPSVSQEDHAGACCAAGPAHVEPAPTKDPTPFLCRRWVRLTIYSILVFVLLVMLGWRFIPVLTDPTFEKHIQSKRVVVGMSREQAMQAWGSPYQTNISYTKDGLRREEWIYEDWKDAGHVKHRYLYFEEGILVGGWYQ